MSLSSLIASVILYCFLELTCSPQAICVSYIKGFFVIFYHFLSVYQFLPTFPVFLLYFITVVTLSLCPILISISELIQSSFKPVTTFSRLSGKYSIFFSFFYVFSSRNWIYMLPKSRLFWLYNSKSLKNIVKCCLGFYSVTIIYLPFFFLPFRT